MSLFDWFANRQKKDPEIQSQPEREFPDGLWTKCESCGAVMYTKDFHANQMVCLECEHHMRVNSNDRIQQLIDEGTWQPLNEAVQPVDPLGFADRKPYVDRVRDMQEKTQLTDAVQTGIGQLDGMMVALAVMDFRFMGGSMGSVVGEKITRLVEAATQQRLPVFIACASGGARMQEGMLSLMQMAKISGALARHQEQRLLYVPILTHPTAGGVTASFAMLGDLILAEPKATIAFAGRRVVEQTIREKLPDDFQTAEYLLDHGFIDMIVPRPQMKTTLSQLLKLHHPLTPAAANGAAEANNRHLPDVKTYSHVDVN
ncbi:acetyl-CoA carboxylase, carboxyltransferase subunit beta [filamentous cyanobacterium LEGE 11480]|uniref:Acetyl-coenzyme A carboxylase carboxyl transferase subunit beta n=1 Tax=Romeriopsis navalis LEGE 11480 TaxID=2777977 RepID=A0A928Z2Y3_9CYAN|nr:acetyl-CoA carboxylase, carboxyltransferase subunit beta [Romeriopsis navalis]MBE9030901.1 acetyl-CoA carboxylase, carboxyltransferase subunit beta [Romeriopsis navalis LEGE 11480]